MSVKSEIQDVGRGNKLEWPPGDVRDRLHLKIRASKYSMPKIESSGIAGVRKATKDLEGDVGKMAKEMGGFVGGALATAKAVAFTASDLAFGLAEPLTDWLDKNILAKAFKQGEEIFTVRMYIPGAFDDTQSTTYGDYSTDIEKAIVNKVVNTNLPGAIGEKVSTLGGLMSDGDNLQKLMLWKSGKATAPAETLIFKEVSRTSFSLTWKMIPHNHDEAIIMLAIATAFKRAVKPSIDPGGAPFFTYPPMFDIMFCPSNSNTAVSSGQFKHYRHLALNNVTANYAGGESMTWFEDEIPTSIDLTLGFESMMVPYNIQGKGTKFWDIEDRD